MDPRESPAAETRAVPALNAGFEGDPRAAATVDVLIAVFNAAPFLRETLDSVWAQTVRPERVIVVDDGSTDGSGAMLDAEPGITLCRHPNGANRGQAASLSLALEHASARYVAILDADDVWYPRKLEQHLALMTAQPALALTYSDGWVVDSSRQRLWPLLPTGHVESHDVNALLLNCYIRNPSSVVLRRDALLAAGGLRSGLVPWDHDLWLRIAERHPIEHIDDYLCEYRQHSAQLSRSRRQWEDARRVLQDAATRHAYRPRTLRKRAAVLDFRLGQHDLAHGHRWRALGYLSRAALLDPRRALHTLFEGV